MMLVVIELRNAWVNLAESDTFDCGTAAEEWRRWLNSPGSKPNDLWVFRDARCKVIGCCLYREIVGIRTIDNSPTPPPTTPGDEWKEED